MRRGRRGPNKKLAHKSYFTSMLQWCIFVRAQIRKLPMPFMRWSGMTVIQHVYAQRTCVVVVFLQSEQRTRFATQEPTVAKSCVTTPQYNSSTPVLLVLQTDGPPALPTPSSMKWKRQLQMANRREQPKQARVTSIACPSRIELLYNSSTAL